MTRLVNAAKVLIAQASEQRPRTSTAIIGDPDGLGVYRTVRFNKQTGKWLAPLLEEIDDPRIEEVVDDGSHLYVTFAAGPKADSKSPFPLEAAAELQAG